MSHYREIVKGNMEEFRAPFPFSVFRTVVELCQSEKVYFFFATVGFPAHSSFVPTEPIDKETWTLSAERF